MVKYSCNMLLHQIEAIRRNPGRYNNLLVSNASLSSKAIPAQQSQSWHIESYKDIILGESNSLYDRLLKYFTDSIIDKTAFKRMSLSSNSLSQYSENDTCRIEDSESFHDSKGDIAD
jgi:hypothetical protein